MAEPAKDPLFRALERAVGSDSLFLDGEALQAFLHPIWVEYVVDLIRARYENDPELAQEAAELFRSMPADEQQRMFAGEPIGLEEFVSAFAQGRDEFLSEFLGPPGDA